MKIRVSIIVMLVCIVTVSDLTLAHGYAARPAPLRVALIGFSGAITGDDQTQAALQSALALSPQVTLIDAAQIKPALAGVGYDGSINMTRDEARRVGASIGCDFFITGKRDSYIRSDTKGESHEEALVGVMIVDARTGELAAFDFLNTKAATRVAAIEALTKLLEAHAVTYYVEQMIAHRAGRDAARNISHSAERIEDLPDADSAASAGFEPPEFLNRVKPQYTDEADRANITASVEAMAVFRADGTVGEVRVTRWAGFGLEESAESAIRQLKFKPAQRDGQPISVRAAVRYNFRRVTESPKPPITPVEQPAEKPVPDLRQYFPQPHRPPSCA